MLLLFTGENVVSSKIGNTDSDSMAVVITEIERIREDIREIKEAKADAVTKAEITTVYREIENLRKNDQQLAGAINEMHRVYLMHPAPPP